MSAVVSLDSTKVNLKWTGSVDLGGVKGYKVYRDSVEIGTSASTSYSNTSVVSGATYSYAVKAFDAAGNVSGASNSVTAVIPEGPKILSILSYSVTNKTMNSATITWTTNYPSTGVISYGALKRSLNLSATDSIVGTSHSVTLTGLQAFTNYSYKITAVNEDGSSSAFSPVSSFKTLRK